MNGPHFSKHGSPRGSHSPLSSLAEVGSFSVEFLSLAYHTGDPEFKQKADEAMAKIELKAKMSNELYPLIFKSDDMSPVVNISSVGAKADSFYEYLLKRWVHSDKDRIPENSKDPDKLYEHHSYLVEWKYTMDLIFENMIEFSDDDYLYVGDFFDDEVLPRMEHLSCFLPGTIALGVYLQSLSDVTVLYPREEKKYMNIAEKMARTCYAMYATSGSKGLSPEFVYFNPNVW